MRAGSAVSAVMVAVVLGSAGAAPAFDPGDMNCDGVVDSLDCPIMRLAMTDPDGYGASYPGCPLENADVNGDGLIDCVDFPLFVAAVALTSPGGCGFMDCPLQPGSIFAVGDGPDPDYAPAVSCSEASMTCLVVWRADTTASRSIWGRFAGVDGVAFGEPFQITAMDTSEWPASVAHDPVRNRFLVVWSQEYSTSPPDNDIWARFVPMAGPDPGEPPFPVSTAFDFQVDPSVAYAPGADEFLVAWTNEVLTSSPTINGRRVRADGSGFATGDLVLSEGPQQRSGPVLEWDDANSRYVLAYNRYELSTGLDVWLRRISWSGAQIGVETGIAAWPGTEGRISLAILDGAPLVAWEAGGRSYVRWADNDGLPAGPPLDLTDGGIASAFVASVACDDHGAGCRVAVAWNDGISLGLDIVDRQVSANGSLGPVEEVRRSPDGHVQHSGDPNVAAVGGNFVRVWRQEPAPGYGSNLLDIHARVYKSLLFDDGFESGDTLWWSATVGD